MLNVWHVKLRSVNSRKILQKLIMSTCSPGVMSGGRLDVMRTTSVAWWTAECDGQSFGEKQLAADLRQRSPSCVLVQRTVGWRTAAQSATAASRHDLTTDGDRLEDIRRVPGPAGCLPRGRPAGCCLRGRSLRPTPNSSAQANERPADDSKPCTAAKRLVTRETRHGLTYDVCKRPCRSGLVVQRRIAASFPKQQNFLLDGSHYIDTLTSASSSASCSSDLQWHAECHLSPLAKYSGISVGVDAAAIITIDLR